MTEIVLDGEATKRCPACLGLKTVDSLERDPDMIGSFRTFNMVCTTCLGVGVVLVNPI